MTNYTPATHPLIGNWKSEIGFFLGIEEVMDHGFKGWFRCLKEGPYYPVRREIDGLVRLERDATIQLVFFCDGSKACDPAHNYVFHCEVRQLRGKPYMQLHWLEYSSGDQQKTLSEGFSILSRDTIKAVERLTFL